MALEDCDLNDLGFFGPQYTWCNSRSDGNFTQERLDRAVVISDWCSRFQHPEFHVLAARTSDHNPILISYSELPLAPNSYRRGFKLEANWQLDPECRDIIKAVWEQEVFEANRMKDIQFRLSACQINLTRWSKQKFEKDAELLKLKSKSLLELQRNNCPDQVDSIKQIQKEIDDILEREDVKWKQRAKQNLYRQGDRNTQFFHAWANHRRKVNNIRSITNDQGRTWRRNKEVCKVFIDYYKDIFSSNASTDFSQCLEHVEPRVSAEMNSNLLRSFTEEEVCIALSQMHPLKSPGPDGFSAGFFQKAWCTVGREVTEAVLSFLNGGPFDAAINATNICLIPKVSSPETIKDY